MVQMNYMVSSKKEAAPRPALSGALLDVWCRAGALVACVDLAGAVAAANHVGKQQFED